MATNLRVHIVPIGFDFRRATDPLIRMRADRVYFLRYDQNDADKEFFASITKELHDRMRDIQIETRRADLWDPYKCIEQYREIIIAEKGNGNHVYVNVSTGTRINSIAGMLACMMWGGEPYYARLTYPKAAAIQVPPTEFIDDADILPVYEIKKPEPESMLILHLLDLNEGKMRKIELINKLEEAGVIKPKDTTAVRRSETWKHSQLNGWLYPMENELHYIEVRASGRRSEVYLTKQGKTALRIFGTEV